MPSPRFLILALLPLFAGCQLFDMHDSAPSSPALRLQGELTRLDGRLLLTPCGEQRRIALVDDAGSEIAHGADELFADGQEKLFVDLLGTLSDSTASDVAGELRPSLVYRLQGEGPGCGEPGFEHLLLRASGHEPDWSLGVSNRGLVLLRPGQPPLALPYLEEQLPDGRSSLSTEANGQRLELWLAPQRCVDSMSGAVQHLSAELRINDEVQRGCASFGGARNH